MHTIFVSEGGLDAPTLTLEGEEAKHATRVKRVGEGDTVRLLDGQGVIALGTVERAQRELVVRIVERRDAPRPVPRLEIWSATPKGDRLSTIIEGLVQCGGDEWVALETKLGVVEPGAGKLDRVARIAREAAKQALQPWVMQVGRRGTLDQALARDGAVVVMLDAWGEDWHEKLTQSAGAACPLVRLLVGPEGGWTAEERASARAAGAALIRLGPHVMRIETAAVVACALARNTQSRVPTIPQ